MTYCYFNSSFCCFLQHTHKHTAHFLSAVCTHFEYNTHLFRKQSNINKKKIYKNKNLRVFMWLFCDKGVEGMTANDIAYHLHIR